MQSNDQQAYDRGVTVFSPDGRLYQVEYAREAVKRGSPSVGLCTTDSVVLAANSRRRSPLMAAESVEKIHDVDGHLAMATAGHVADGRRLVDYGRQFAQRERLRYGEAPSVEPVAKAIADFIQETTQTGGTRPFGAALLLGGVVDGTPALYEIDPSGTPSEWHASAIGNGTAEARAHLETVYEGNLDRDEAISLGVEALAETADEVLNAPELEVVVLDDEGIEVLDLERREAVLTAIGLDEA